MLKERAREIHKQISFTLQTIPLPHDNKSSNSEVTHYMQANFFIKWWLRLKTDITQKMTQHYAAKIKSFHDNYTQEDSNFYYLSGMKSRIQETLANITIFSRFSWNLRANLKAINHALENEAGLFSPTKQLPPLQLKARYYLNILQILKAEENPNIEKIKLYRYCFIVKTYQAMRAETDDKVKNQLRKQLIEIEEVIYNPKEKLEEQDNKRYYLYSFKKAHQVLIMLSNSKNTDPKFAEKWHKRAGLAVDNLQKLYPRPSKKYWNTVQYLDAKFLSLASKKPLKNVKNVRFTPSMPQRNTSTTRQLLDEPTEKIFQKSFMPEIEKLDENFEEGLKEAVEEVSDQLSKSPRLFVRKF